MCLFIPAMINLFVVKTNLRVHPLCRILLLSSFIHPRKIPKISSSVTVTSTFCFLEIITYFKGVRHNGHVVVKDAQSLHIKCPFEHTFPPQTSFSLPQESHFLFGIVRPSFQFAPNRWYFHSIVCSPILHTQQRKVHFTHLNISFGILGDIMPDLWQA